MSLGTFTPPRAPVLGAKKTVSYRMRHVDFGDGYVQRSADGINNKMVSWDLNWSALAPADGDSIESFFDSLGGWTAFLYTVNGDIQRKYTVSAFSRILAEGKSDSISVTLTEVFDP